MSKLPKPFPEAIIYEDDRLYVCLANFPLTEGHTVVVWKEELSDLSLLSQSEYQHLMTLVNQTRNALLSVLNLEKVYLLYLDETKHAHWHLIPRYQAKGLDVLNQTPSELTDCGLAKKIQDRLTRLKA